jgi:hypothetical protein
MTTDTYARAAAVAERLRRALGLPEPPPPQEEAVK